MTKPKLLVLIPAFNEEHTIKKVIRDIKSHTRKYATQIIVINDGSLDSTEKIANEEKVIVLTHILNRGLGASINTGLEYAKAKVFDVLITFDADGQHEAIKIPALVKPILSGKADIAIGSRLHPKSKRMPPERMLVNKIANLTTFLLTGVYSSDTQSGFRGFSKKAVNLINITSQRMEVSSEVFKEIKRNNLVFTEVPIDALYTSYSLKKGQSITNAPNVLLKLAISLMRK